MAHKTSWTRLGCRVQVYGDVNSAELKQINEELCASSFFDDIKYFVRDLSGIKSVSFSEDDLRQVAYIAAASSAYKKQLRGAFVIGDSPTEHWVRKFINDLMTAGCQWSIRYFRDSEAAMKWAAAADHERHA